MPQTCSAAGCKSRKDKDCKKSFYRIPVDRGQREQWVAAINRKDWTPTPYSRICSDHFVLGQPSKNPNHPDYAPSIFPGSRKNWRSRVASRNGNKTSPAVLAPIINKSTDQIKRQLSDVDAAEALLHMSKRPRVIAEEICSTKEDRRPSKDREVEEEGTSVGVQQANCRVALLQAENRVLKEEIDKLQIQRSELERQKKSLELEKVNLGNHNKQLEAGIWVLWRSLQDSEGRVKELRNEMFLMNVGAETVRSRL